MNSLTRSWRRFVFGRRFARIGRGTTFAGRNLVVEGHVEAGDNCHFRDNVILRTRLGGKIVLADQVGIANYCIIEATERVEIGRDSVLTEFCVVRDTTHLIRGTDAHFRRTPHLAKPTILGEECWIGSGSYIGPGVTIGDGAVVGVGSFVTKDIGPYEVWAGTPARFLFHRTKDVPPEVQAETDRLIQAQGGVRPSRYEDRS